VVRLERLQKVEVAPLDVERIRTFLSHYLGEVAGDRLFWSMAGGDEVLTLWETWQEAGGRWEEFWTAEEMPENVYSKTTSSQDRLWERLRKEPSPLLELGGNPYMLLMTAQVYAGAGGELPANRARLFAAFVDTLLGREKKRSPSKWIEADQLKDGLAALAYAMQVERGRGTTVVREWALEQLCEATPDRDLERLLYLATSATLLDADEAVVRFYHQLLQEYFAARAMGRRLAAGEKLSNYWPSGRWWEPSGWEETAILLAGMEPDASDLLSNLVTVNPVMAGHCLLEGGARVDEATQEKVREALVRGMTGEALPALARVQAGNVLAELGDPRFRKDIWYLPKEPLLGFVEVPAGPFQMGSEKEIGSDAFDDEFPQHWVDLSTYYMARYPVTVAQFRAFVGESGYEAQGPWESWSGPDNHPVVAVTWHDARGYCEWLTEHLRAWPETPEPLAKLLREEGWQVRLPTEAEWEKAARGSDGRIFPWGHEIDPERANCADTGIGSTSAVGCFPGGASPYGVLEMSGNVLEWCHSLGRPYPYKQEDGREDSGAGGGRVLRGGSLDDSLRLVRCACRYWNLPYVRLRYYGFRICVAPGL
jgi:formylglycine-generating enzyme required for sulfatase activity